MATSENSPVPSPAVLANEVETKSPEDELREITLTEMEKSFTDVISAETLLMLKKEGGGKELDERVLTNFKTTALSPEADEADIARTLEEIKKINLTPQDIKETEEFLARVSALDS